MDEGDFVGHKGCNDLRGRAEAERSPCRLDQTFARARPTGEPMNRRFAFLIIAAMVLGVLVGWGCNQYLDAAQTDAQELPKV